MLPLLLHKHWFSNLICYLAASWPLTPPKTKRKKQPQTVLGLILWSHTVSGWREGQWEALCSVGPRVFSCGMLAVPFGTGQFTAVVSICILCWWEGGRAVGCGWTPLQASHPHLLPASNPWRQWTVKGMFFNQDLVDSRPFSHHTSDFEYGANTNV